MPRTRPVALSWSTCRRRLVVLGTRPQSAHPPPWARKIVSYWSGVSAYRYALTPLQYETILRAQGGGCALCGRVPSTTKRRLHVDHDKATGRVRGILCGPCNVTKVGSNTSESIPNVARYLHSDFDGRQL